jgi:recombination protein RecA
MANDKNREKAVDQAISQIERQFGRGSIMKMGEELSQPAPLP